MRTAHLFLALCSCASALLSPRSFLGVRKGSPLLRLQPVTLASTAEETPEVDSTAAAVVDTTVAESTATVGTEAEPMDLEEVRMKREAAGLKAEEEARLAAVAVVGAGLFGAIAGDVFLGELGEHLFCRYIPYIPA